MITNNHQLRIEKFKIVAKATKSYFHFQYNDSFVIMYSNLLQSVILYGILKITSRNQAVFIRIHRNQTKDIT